MKLTNGKIVAFLGVSHVLLALSPWAFGEQFKGFAQNGFLKVSEGLLEFPLMDGQMDYEVFATFWFFYFGLLLIPLGLLMDSTEKVMMRLPKSFVWAYLIMVLVGVYMIPLSGMTFLMLPHALYMLYRYRTSK